MSTNGNGHFDFAERSDLEDTIAEQKDHEGLAYLARRMRAIREERSPPPS